MTEGFFAAGYNPSAVTVAESDLINLCRVCLMNVSRYIINEIIFC